MASEREDRDCRPCREMREAVVEFVSDPVAATEKFKVAASDKLAMIRNKMQK